MENFQLTKKSSSTEIKEYFNAVHNLTESAEEFPVNLNEVWMLVYGRKSDATEALQRDFIEGIDYKVLRQNPQNSNGGRPTNEYKLTLSCMEYFIARKVRPVFEVYRQVFHHATKPMSQLEILAQSVQILQEQEKRVQQLETGQKEIREKVALIEAKQTTHQNWFTIAGYGTLHKVQVGIKLAASLGRKACNLCKQLGVEPEEIPDPRFGKVKTYPENVLKQVFDMPIN